VEGNFVDDVGMKCSSWCRKIELTLDRSGNPIAILKYFPQGKRGSKVINEKLQDYFMYNKGKDAAAKALNYSRD
jgi:hypothetical protein